MRALVVVCLALAFAGCTGGPETISDGRTVIAEDQYYSFSFGLNYDATLKTVVDVLSGPPIDVLIMDTLNFQQFEAGNAFVHYTSCDGVAASGFVKSCTLPAGDYVVVLDNSDAGNTSPPFNGVDDGADTIWTITAS